MSVANGEANGEARDVGRAAIAGRAAIRGLPARLLMGVAALALCAAGVQAQQAVQQPVPPPTQPAAPRKKALEIRGQAPAPEVVTVRPREVPQFTRRLISPALYDVRPAPAASRARATVVLLPGQLPEVRSSVTNPTRPPE
jgi:hypothetical protein